MQGAIFTLDDATGLCVGVERVACWKYNGPDLRMLLEGDMRFLRQF